MRRRIGVCGGKGGGAARVLIERGHFRWWRGRALGEEEIIPQATVASLLPPSCSMLVEGAPADVEKRRLRLERWSGKRLAVSPISARSFEGAIFVDREAVAEMSAGERGVPIHTALARLASLLEWRRRVGVYWGSGTTRVACVVRRGAVVGGPRTGRGLPWILLTPPTRKGSDFSGGCPPPRYSGRPRCRSFSSIPPPSSRRELPSLPSRRGRFHLPYAEGGRDGDAAYFSSFHGSWFPPRWASGEWSTRGWSTSANSSSNFNESSNDSSGSIRRLGGEVSSLSPSSSAPLRRVDRFRPGAAVGEVEVVVGARKKTRRSRRARESLAGGGRENCPAAHSSSSRRGRVVAAEKEGEAANESESSGRDGVPR